jgi:hypothetical protein
MGHIDFIEYKTVIFVGIPDAVFAHYEQECIKAF